MEADRFQTFSRTLFDRLAHLFYVNASQHLMTFLTEAWFWRGTQSAIFYYVSCAPCTRVRDQRRKRKEAKQAKSQREMTVTEGFQQALPSCTNPGWDEEIVLGPGPPPARLSKKELRKRDLLREKLSSTYIAESDSAKSITRVGTTSTPDNNSGKSMSPGTRSKLSEESWYSRRYQRKDEPLWGRNSDSMTSLGRISSIAHTIKHPESYYHPRNPEINDFNPPIISNIPLSPAENLWMLQPPPRAKVMEGKIRAETCFD